MPTDERRRDKLKKRTRFGGFGGVSLLAGKEGCSEGLRVSSAFVMDPRMRALARF